MPLQTAFIPAALVEMAANPAALKLVIQQSPHNAFLIGQKHYSKGWAEGALKYIDTENPRFSYLFIADETRKIRALCSFDANEQDCVALHSVAVRPEHKNIRYGKTLLHAVFARAQNTGRALRIATSFSGDGVRYLLPAFAAVHNAYPEVSVYFRQSTTPVKGDRPYRAVQDGQGSVHILEPETP